MISDTSRPEDRKVTNFFGRASDLKDAIKDLSSQISDIERDIAQIIDAGNGPDTFQNHSYAVSYRREKVLPELYAKLKSAELLHAIIVDDVGIPEDKFLLITLTTKGSELVTIHINSDV